MINDLTRKLVIQTARQHPREAQLNDDAFLSKLQVAHGYYISVELLIPLKFRALEIWQLFHPEHFDEEGFINDLDIEDALSRCTCQVADRICSRKDSGYRLTEFGNLPLQISTPMIPHDVELFYRPELEWSIAYMSKHKNVYVKTLRNLLLENFSPLPFSAAENIAKYVTSIVLKNPTIGLPLFNQHYFDTESEIETNRAN